MFSGNVTSSALCASGIGGAIFNFSGTLTIYNSELYGNRAGGGLGGAIAEWTSSATVTSYDSALFDHGAGAELVGRVANDSSDRGATVSLARTLTMIKRERVRHR